MEKINEWMLVGDVLDMDAGITDVLIKNGMNCLGCPGSYNENLKEAAEGHGISLDKLIADLNAYLDNKEK